MKVLFAILLATTLPVLVSAQQDHERAAIKRGNELVAQEKYEAAIREYELLSPTAGELYARALYNIGVCHYELWRTDQAIDFYSQAIAASKNRYPRASYALGVALEDESRFAEARNAYEESIVASRGDFAPAQHRLGLLMTRAGNYTRAVRLYKDAIRRPGDHLPASHNNLGVILAWTGHLKEAEVEFKIALRLTDGTQEDASHNLKLCRYLLAKGMAEVALFKISDTAGGPPATKMNLS